MILVDTSMLIDYLKGSENDKVTLFDTLLKQDQPYGISSYTYLEVLQGSKHEQEYKTLKEYLSTQTIYYLPESIETYDKAANLYFQLRRQGVTPRSVIDILISLTAIEYQLYLLHNDRDFDIIADKTPELKIYPLR